MLMDNNKEIIKVIAEKEICDKKFRVWGTPEEPLFLAKDVGIAIGYKDNPSLSVTISKLVDDDEKIKIAVSPMLLKGRDMVDCMTNWRNTKPQKAWFLTEDGLYEVLMVSKMPKAKQFKKEVKKILKDIRLTGGYIPVTDNMTDDELLARAYEIAQRTLNMKVNQLN